MRLGGHWNVSRRRKRTISRARCYALLIRRTNSRCSSTMRSIPCRFSLRASMLGSNRRKTGTPPSGRAPKATGNGMEPALPPRRRFDFSVTSHTRPSSRRIPVITGSSMAALKKRLLHALDHTFVAHRDNGSHMFNYSEWMGATTTVVVSDRLHQATNTVLVPALSGRALRSSPTWAWTYSGNFGPKSPAS